MPSTYAHYRMGQDVRKLLKGRERNIIEKHAELYLIGLHGPDILFYYRAISSNPVNQIGTALHKRLGSYFFKQAKAVLKHLDKSKASEEEKDAYRAYVFGVLTHFALDADCHGYVNEKMEETGIQHTEIEGEFDRYLLLKDKRDPVTSCLIRHIHPTLENAAVIQPFYQGISRKEILQSLKDIRTYNQLLLAKTNAKRQLLYGVMKAVGKYEELHGMVINPTGNPLCKESNEVLYARYQEATMLAVEFIQMFLDYVEDKIELPKYFSYNFDSILVEENA